MSERRVRIVRFVVAIEAVVDDGEHLTPLAVDPVPYLAADAALFDLDHVQAALQRHVDAQETQPAERTNAGS
jgi:hypothetical protein